MDDTDCGVATGGPGSTLARMKRFFSTAFRLAVVAGLSLAGLAGAQDNPMKPAAPAAGVHFVRADGLEVAKIVPAPPAAGSLAANADVETVLQVQAARTPEQIAWANVVDQNDLFAAFGAGNLLGPRFKKENFPLLLALLKNINDDLRPLVDASKKFFARPRPHLADPRVTLCVPVPANDAYPSGHSYGAYMRAAVLAEIFPEKRTEIFERARYFAWGRVMGGVHYPTDLEGGRRLAEAGFAELKKSAAYRAAVEQCRAEAAAAALKKAA